MVNDDFSPKREGEVPRNRDCVGGLEGMRKSGEFLTKAESDPTRHTAWIQNVGRGGYGESDLGGKFGAAVVRYCT